ncbi:MAG: serine/threonine protein kinase [Polyangiaceae bacterium]|nr:serine/threonine protein kinase [Polyangiaceae bacterium]
MTTAASASVGEGNIARPTRVVFAMPVIVAALGLILLLLGQSALRSSNRELARGQFVTHSKAVAWTIDDALGQADPLRERLKEIALSWDVRDDPTAHAYELSDLLLGRPGLAYVSVSFPDGTFAGVYLEDDGRATRFQISEVVAPGKTKKHIWDPTGRRGLVHVLDEETAYDPRTRDFYKLALSKPGPVWTEPYPFYQTNVTGITLAEAVHERDRPDALHAVITIDFDIEALSAVMSQTQKPEGAVLVLHAADGTILAAPGFRERYPNLQYPGNRPLAIGDLDDPVLKRLVARSSFEASALWDFEERGVKYLAASERVGERHGLPWYTSMSVEEERFLAALPSLRQQSLVASAVAVSVALLVSLFLARHLTRARRAVAEATAKAEVAEGRAKELGSYRLVARLAQGGMGEVWRAEHRLLARPAAIKLIRADTTDPEGHRIAEERFRREAETLAGLSSRHTVQIFDYGVSEDGTFYLVMELLDGIDLDHLVSNDGPQPAARVISILLQVLGSLREAHDVGLVHRDIKPGNLFLSRAADEVDIVKVLDFGVVRAAVGKGDKTDERGAGGIDYRAPSDASMHKLAESNVNLTTKDGYLGTPGYMAPEQIRHQPVDGRTDLYSLGCVAYYLLTGDMMFASNSSMSTMVAHMTKPPPSPRAKVKGWLPEELERIVLDCLAKDPSKRPPNAKVVVERLRAIDIPPEHTWTPDRAEVWWGTFRREGAIVAAETGRLIVARS